MRHPTEGVLRRLLDEPAAIPDADRTHVDECPECHAELVAIRADADLASAALATDTAEPDIDAAWHRLTSATDVAGHADVVVPMRRPNRFRQALRRPVVAGVAVAAVLAGASTAAANDWFEIFRTERVAPVLFRAEDLNALPDLRAYGELVVDEAPDVREVADAAAAAAATGLDVPEVADLPRGVDGEPTYRVGDEVRATFTFSTDRAARAAADAGESLPPPPTGLDGSEVRLVAGPGIAAVWRDSGVPSLVVGRAMAPRAFSADVPFETVRDYLLSLPGMPDDVAAQLRTFAADPGTLPIPVPADHLTSSPAEIDGHPATVLASRDRTMAAVVWVDDGIVTVVAGSLDADEVLTVARELA